MWTREVYEVLEQCVTVPGEISRITLHYLEQQCIAHGCRALNQLQLLLRVRGNAETVLERFLLRLDERGLEISSPWGSSTDSTLLEALWPRLHKAWLEKERWAGCTEVIDEVRNEWDQAQLCLKACGKLGSAEPAITSIRNFSDSQHQWLHVEALKKRKCHLTTPEHTALTSWLSMMTAQEMCAAVPLAATSGGVQSEHPAQHVRRPKVLDPDPATHATVPTRTPPCIRGQIIGIDQHDHLLLKSLLPMVTPDLDISGISDQLLAEYLCQTRSIFPFQQSEHVVTQVECLLPLRAVSSPRSHPEYIIVRSLTDEDAPLTVMQTALVRDCLRGADRERLDAACGRPCWSVNKNEYYAGHGLHKLSGCRALSWKLQPGSSPAQSEMRGLVQYVTHRSGGSGQHLVSTPQPWQTDPPLPPRIVIDLSHHHPRSLPAPVGWEVIQRNGRVWLAERNAWVVKMDAAQYHMLLATCGDQDAKTVPTELTLARISDSCRAQKDADLVSFIHWSRHLVASIRKITRCELLIGASAVTYNPHFPYFSSPHALDVHFGAVEEWPHVPALLLIDSFAPHLRCKLLERAMTHGAEVWVLRQHKGRSDDPDLVVLNKTSRLYAELPKKSMVMHKSDCWETAAWDVEQSRYSTQLWRLHPHATIQKQGPDSGTSP